LHIETITGFAVSCACWSASNRDVPNSSIASNTPSSRGSRVVFKSPRLFTSAVGVVGEDEIA
jgi:hypothetical protein